MDHDVRLELYLSLVLLGADPMLRGALEAWREEVDEHELLVDLRNWNEAKVLEMQEWLPTMSGAELEAARERIREYEEARAALGQEA
jgi:CHASE3 domain sensor protein